MHHDNAPTALATQVPAEPAPAPQQPARDLAMNTPGQSAQAEADRVLALVHPFKRWLHRVFTINTEGEAWRRGALGERLAGAEMLKLGPEWRALHAIPVGIKGSDIDHLLIGPGGVFTVNTKNHWRSKVWCGGRSVMVNGHKQPYVRNSTHEAARAAKILSAACGHPVEVSGLLLFITAAGNLTIKPPREAIPVTFLHYQQLRRWAKKLPVVLTQDEVGAIYGAARVSSIWTVPPKPPRSRKAGKPMPAV